MSNYEAAIKGQLVLKGIPKLRAQDSEKPLQSVVHAKVFGAGRYTFFITEFDGNDRVFGYCLSGLGADCDEWGYASVREWETLPLPMLMEVDSHFEPQTMVSALQQIHRHGLAGTEQYA